MAVQNCVGSQSRIADGPPNFFCQNQLAPNLMYKLEKLPAVVACDDIGLAGKDSWNGTWELVQIMSECQCRVIRCLICLRYSWQVLMCLFLLLATPASSALGKETINLKP